MGPPGACLAARFGVVNSGFIVQGLALGALFALYAGDRWGHLWRGALRHLPYSPTAPALRVAAVAASLTALVPGTPHLLRATGSASGLNTTRIAERTGDFYALEAVYRLFVAVAVAGRCSSPSAVVPRCRCGCRRPWHGAARRRRPAGAAG